MTNTEQETQDTQVSVSKIESLANATALKSLLNDPRWVQFIEPTLATLTSRAAMRREKAGHTLDALIEGEFNRGIQEGLNQFKRTLRNLSHMADRVIEDARKNRPV